MTVLLILATFAVFLTIDYFYSRRRAVQPTTVPARQAQAAARVRPGLVAGFELPLNRRYHPGHTWAANEGMTRVRIGLDDFAAHLIGTVEKLSVPMRGRWVRQGQKLATLTRKGSEVELVAPIEGMVVDVNDAVLKDPQRALADPYGAGWLVDVDSPDAKTNFRNLLTGSLAKAWMQDAAARLASRLSATIGTAAMATAQDGGVAMPDLAKDLPEADWAKLAREFFLS